MFKRRKIKKMIVESEAEILSLEQKLMRSQTSLVKSYATNTKPNPEDVEYFNLYFNLIEVERANLRQLKKNLEELKK